MIAVGPHQHRDRAEPVQGDDRGQRARARLHQHADVLALAHADLEQAPDDVVDPLVDRRAGVAAVLEQQRHVLGRALGLLVDQQAEGDPRPGADPAEPVEPAELPGGAPSSCAGGAGRADAPPRRAPARRRSRCRRRARGRCRSGRRSRRRRRSGMLVADRARRPRAAAAVAGSRCRAQAATVGQVVSTEVEPTTRPK